MAPHVPPTIIPMPIMKTYVNQFTVTDRQVNGKVWYDTDADDIIDPGEAGVYTTVKMQRLGDDGSTWTDALDWSGAALTTYTDSAGNYRFDGVLPGKYRVLAMDPGSMVHPTNRKSSALPSRVMTENGSQGDCDSDADQGTIWDSNGTWAVVQTLDKTNQAFTPTANTYYTHNVDIGLCLYWTSQKACQIISTGNMDQGSAVAQ